MLGSEGLWCSSNIYGETRTLATFSRTMAIPETRRYPSARLSFLLEKNNRRALCHRRARLIRDVSSPSDAQTRGYHRIMANIRHD
jgi:hypothetical protein